MERYNISQTPSKAPRPKLKNFFIAKGKTKKLNKQTLLTITAVAIVVIAIGIVFAIIRLKSQVQPLHGSLPPLAQHTTTSKSNGAGIYLITQTDINNIFNAVTQKNASLLGSYFASQVHITIVGSGINETVSSNDAGNIIDSGLNNASNPWDFHVPASTLSQWQDGTYGSYFSGNDLVGVSSNGTVISVAFDNTGQIITVLIVPEGDLSPPGDNGSGSNSDNSSGNGTTIPVNSAD